MATALTSRACFARHNSQPRRSMTSPMQSSRGSEVVSLPGRSNQDVEDAFLTQRFYAMTQARIRLLLGAIDHLLRSEDPKEPEAVITYNNLQIEHIMPQSWEQHWPLSDADGNQVAKNDADPVWINLSTERRRAVDRIGNLTLVTGSFNGSVSNLGWLVKRPEFEKQKSLVINHAVAQQADWSERSIEEREDPRSRRRAIVPAPESLLSPQ